MDEIIRPHFIGPGRTHSFTAAARQPPAFTRLSHHLQLRLAPHPLDPLAVDRPSFTPQQLRDESITIRRIFAAQSPDPSLQPSSPSVGFNLAVKRGLGQTQRITGSIDRTLLPLHQILRGPSPRRGAYHFFEFTSSRS